MRSVRRLRSAKVLLVGLVAAGALDACGDSTEERLRAANLAEGCKLDSDCSDPLVCVFERCHYECATDRDCEKYGARCVRTPSGDGVCQLPMERECVRDKDCVGDQVCATDGQCRDACAPSLMCFEAQVCAKGGVCASTMEVDARGNLIDEGGSSGAGGGTGAGGSAGDGSGGAATGGRGSETGGSAGSGDAAGGSNEGGGTSSGGTWGSGGSVGEGGSSQGGASTGGSGEGGGSAATGGAGGVGGDEGVVDEIEPNETREMPMPIGTTTQVQSSFTAASDTDFFEVTAPDAPAGGCFSFSITDIPRGEFNIAVLSAVNFGEIMTGYTATVGQSWFGYWLAAPSQKYLIQVSAKAGQAYPYNYRLGVKYVPGNDAFEPNDTRQTATALTLGEPVHGQLLAGFTSSTMTTPEWADWYRVELAAGPVSALLTNVPSDMNARFALLNSGGSQVAQSFEGTLGADVALTYTVPTAGTYYYSVGAYDRPAGHGSVTSPDQVPAFCTDQYTFTVTQ